MKDTVSLFAPRLQIVISAAPGLWKRRSIQKGKRTVLFPRGETRTFIGMISALALGSAIVFAPGCGLPSQKSAQEAKERQGILMAAVDGARIRSANRDPGNWMSYGRTY